VAAIRNSILSSASRQRAAAPALSLGLLEAVSDIGSFRERGHYSAF
jgi:hypothetical protein